MIVARHEVPGLEFGHFREQNSRHDPGELGLLGVERDSLGLKGLKNLAQGLPWVFRLMPKALKGRPLTRPRGDIPKWRWPLQGFSRWGAFPRVNPRLSSHGPLGRRPAPNPSQALRAWLLIRLSLRDETISPIVSPRIILACLWVLNPGTINSSSPCSESFPNPSSSSLSHSESGRSQSYSPCSSRRVGDAFACPETGWKPILHCSSACPAMSRG
jgi:hypothetical protein